LNNKLHREDGPAVEHSDGHKAWFLNGQRHREDGPAIEYSDGHKVWYLNGEHLTEDEFNERMAPAVGMTMAEISEALGKNVRMLNLSHKWLKTLLKMSPTVEMTVAEIEEALGKKVKIIK
jgi:hypothetical protein